jgi:hypothetical protein
MSAWEIHLSLPWRVGRKLGRTIYAQPGRDPGDDDYLVGLVESRELAQEVVAAHNYKLLMERP